MRIQMIAILLASAMSQTAYANSGFADTRIAGLRLLIGRNSPLEAARLTTGIAPGSLCDTVYSALQPMKDDLTNQFVQAVNAAVKSKIDGVSVVRYNLELSQSCDSYATVSPIVNDHASSIVLHISLPGNRFTANLTTPDAKVLGVKIGPPEGMDPRMTVHFDVDAQVTVPLPGNGSIRFGAPQAQAVIRNVSLPEGENPTGDFVSWLTDIGTSIYDHFNNGEIGRTLGSGWGAGTNVAGDLVSQLNAAIAQHAADRNQVTVSLASEGMLDIDLNSGEKLDDPHCISGFVWRQVKPDDLVCVTPEVRAQVRADNATALGRAVPWTKQQIIMHSMCMRGASCGGVTQLPPRSCLSGYVWREAVENDYVCVTPATRAQAKEDNLMARRRRVDFEEVIH